MAVSWRIVVFLLALITFGFMYGVLAEATDTMEPEVVDGLDSEESNQGYEYFTRGWLFAPVFVFVAAGAWLIKQGVVVSR